VSDLPADKRWTFLRIGLIAAILLSYSPLYTAEFTCWDDSYNVAQNARLSPPTWENVGYYWAHSAYDIYIPVTYTVWAGIARIAYVDSPDANGSHLNSYLFHGANVVVHAGSALLVLEILRRLRFNAWAAGIGASVFAMHPIQVEAVGWVAGMKDVLAGMLSLAAILLNLPQSDPPSNLKPRTSLSFIFATLCVTLAMLAKPIAMMTPLIAIAIDLCLLGRFRPRVLIWFVPAIMCAIIARLAQPAAFAGIVVPLWARPTIAGDSIAFYLYKLVWPVKFCVDYGRTPRETLASHCPYLTALVPLAIAVVLWIKRRAIPAVVIGAVIILLGILPVSGLVPFDFQIYSTVADHYFYLPMFGVAMIVASALNSKQIRALAVVVIALLGVQSWRQSLTWKDSISLFSHALEVNPRSWTSHDNLARAALQAGKIDEAKAQCLAAIAINPNVGVTYDKLAVCLAAEGKEPEAIDAYRTAARLQETDPTAWAGLGDLLSKAGDRTGAIDAYTHAVDATPLDANLQVNLASLLAEDGEFDRAIETYRTALRINPKSPEAIEGLARAEKDKQERVEPQMNTDEHR
jgi:Flp pilus assembly protein TadD